MGRDQMSDETVRHAKHDDSYWLDTPRRYGIISRAMHWGMAYLLIWQFFSIFLWKAFGPAEWVKTVTSFGPYHGTVGLLIFPLVILRALWAWGNRTRRPRHEKSTMGRAARTGHVVLYLLMFAIPALALLRAYGNGKGWNPWGLPLIPATGEERWWLIAPANALHSTLSWLLAALIAGHIIMALFHAIIRKDGIFSRMAGPLRKRSRGAGGKIQPEGIGP